MSHSFSRRQVILAAALAMLALRALTPDGYMPGSPQSGLLFELCPDGMPAGSMQMLAGESGHHHHHGRGGGSSTAATEQCPIGHMLASAIAADADVPLDMAPAVPLLLAAIPVAKPRRQIVEYRSRAPPT